MAYKSKQTQDYGDDIEFDPKASTFKDLIMLHYNRCIKAMSVEFRGGYYTKAQGKDGMEKEIYISDTREIFSNSILALAIMIKPKYDEEMKKKYKEYKDKLIEIKQTFMEESSPSEDIILGDAFYESEEDRMYLETYKQKKLELHIELFEEVSDLLGRKNYLTIGEAIY